MCCSPWGHKELEATGWLNNNILGLRSKAIINGAQSTHPHPNWSIHIQQWTNGTLHALILLTSLAPSFTSCDQTVFQPAKFPLTSEIPFAMLLLLVGHSTSPPSYPFLYLFPFPQIFILRATSRKPLWLAKSITPLTHRLITVMSSTLSDSTLDRKLYEDKTDLITLSLRYLQSLAQCMTHIQKFYIEWNGWTLIH